VITQHLHAAPVAGVERVLLIMLPGAGSEAGAFAEHGLIDAVHARGLAVDIVAVQPALDRYLEGDIASLLHRRVVEPARAQNNYTRVWLLGISLGGMAALLYASAHAAELEGLVLLAPFLGTRGTIAELARAGGLASWSPANSSATQPEQRMLSWLQNFLKHRPASPKLYLGYGHNDRFAPGHRILAELLPEGDVVTAEGGHDWPTWRTLWQRVLETAPIATPSGNAPLCAAGR
jgi:pimeloyl-ACP methyl ester carboxylesterase